LAAQVSGSSSIAARCALSWEREVTVVLCIAAEDAWAGKICLKLRQIVQNPNVRRRTCSTSPGDHQPVYARPCRELEPRRNRQRNHTFGTAMRRSIPPSRTLCWSRRHIPGSQMSQWKSDGNALRTRTAIYAMERGVTLPFMPRMSAMGLRVEESTPEPFFEGRVFSSSAFSTEDGAV
jgi:hypothetical protein